MSDLTRKTVGELREIALWQPAERRDILDEMARRIANLESQLAAKDKELERLTSSVADKLMLYGDAMEQLRISKAEIARLISAQDDEAILGGHNFVPSLDAEIILLKAEIERMRPLVEAVLYYWSKHGDRWRLAIAIGEYKKSKLNLSTKPNED